MTNTAQHLHANQAIGRNRVRQSAARRPLKQRPVQTPFSALNSCPIQDTP